MTLDASELALLAASADGVLASAPTSADLADLGWLGLLVPEDAGGSGWLPVEVAVLAECTGRHRSPVPLLSTQLAAAALACGGAEEIEGVLSGQIVAALGVGRLLGDLAVEGDVDRIVVVDPSAPEIGFVVVDVGRGGPDTGLDTTRPWSRRYLVGTAARRIDLGALGRDLLDVALVGRCADTVGALAAEVERLTSYLSDRQAFGAPIASFQAVQHRLVDLAIAVESGRVVTRRAAIALADRTPDRQRLAALAHVHVHGRAVAALDECIQLYGGIGFTWDHPAHHSMRRVTANRSAVLSVSAGRELVGRSWAR